MTMRMQVRRLPPSAEFTIVILVAFGVLIWRSIAGVLKGPNVQAAITADQLQWLIGYEVVVLLLLAGFLRRRGWTTERLGMSFRGRDIQDGLLLALAALAAHAVCYVTAELTGLPTDSWQGSLEPALSDGRFGPATVVLLCVVNPVFEEVFVCGYVITSLTGAGWAWTGVAVSVTLRLLYHLYIGPAAFITIVPLGLVFAYSYHRTGRLWPLIVAHMLFDARLLAQ